MMLKSQGITLHVTIADAILVQVYIYMYSQTDANNVMGPS